jgi:hypothetical protein
MIPFTKDVRIKTTLLLAMSFMVLAGTVWPATVVAENPVWPRPVIMPVPELTAGVTQTVAVVRDNWKTISYPQGEFWNSATNMEGWSDAQIGGGRGGFGGGGRGGRGGGGGALTNEFSTAFKAKISLPLDWAGKRVVLRFESVGGDAKVWVNGQTIREHWGASMPWTCDITGQLKPGDDNWITLGIKNSRDGLAAFVRGGGLGRISLIAVPQNYLSRFHVETKFDSQYKDATLRVWLTISDNDGAGSVKLTLKDASGKEVPLNPSTVQLTRDAADEVFEIPVASPLKWDAEHPNLYTLEASVVDANGNALQTLSRKFGFREIELRGNQVFINGQEVKLRGIWGGNNIAAMKTLNINHTRQKWVTEQFLDQADKLGMYVLDESPVDFAKFGVESDPLFAYQWLDMISDLIERDRDHPSVIMWGLANESFTGTNLLKAFHYTQAEDSQRPVMSSFANRVPVDEELPYSVYSSHYPDLNDPNLNLGSYTVAKWHSRSLIELRHPRPVMPVIHDEYGHIVLNQELLQRDPNVHNFWGESIYRYWGKMFTTKGALGGDLFEFGNLYRFDGDFTSANPEAWLVHNAYSPIRIADGPVPNPGAGRPLSIPIKNWFDHSILKEVTVKWSVGSENGTLTGPDVAPHAAGTLQIPARAWQDGDKLSLKFVASNGYVIDEFLLPVNPPKHELPKPQGPPPKMEMVGEDVIISGDKFKVVINRFRGLISNASYDGKTVLTDGPFLTLLGSGLSYAEWWPDKFTARMEGNEAVIDVVGNYAIFRASFQLRIDGQGLITTKYSIDHVPGEPPPPTYSPWDATSVGGYSEVGVSYMLPNSASTISWRRKALWSVYPEGHIGRPEGSAKLGTDDGRATKENIYEATVDVNGAGVTALSDGRDAVRVYADSNPGRSMVPGIRMSIQNEWNYPDIGLGNYAKPPIKISDGYKNTVYLKLGPNKE